MMKRAIFLSLLGALYAFVFQPMMAARAALPHASDFACTVFERGYSTDTSYDYVHLRCNFLEDSPTSDRISIYSRYKLRGGTSNWKELPGFDEETWIFDHLDDGNPELVIRFYRDGDHAIADLFDRETMADLLDDISLLAMVERQSPKVHVFSHAGTWRSGEIINFNLDILVDGAVLAIPGSPSAIGQHFSYDGSPEVTIAIRDPDFDGRPDFDLRRIADGDDENIALTELPESYLMVNAEDNEPPLEPVFPWPFLGNISYGYLTSAPHPVSQPPIQIDWQSGRIYAIGEFVRSRGNDSQWFVYSFNDIMPGRINATNFESPFAWYDLAGDQDRQAELAVRFGYYPRNDPIFVHGTSDEPINIVRYSWDQDNDGYWDYKLGLLGKNEVTTKVSVANIGLRILPYHDLPGWINEQEWGAITFVAAENGGASGEGIYIWDHPAWFTEGYFLGRDDSPLPPVDNDTSTEFGYGRIAAGYRGEFNNEYLDHIQLYFSPIDRRIHLKNLSEGLWNLDDRQFILYHSTGGEYVDRWEEYRDDVLISVTDYLSGYLLRVDGSSLQIAHPDLPLSAGEFAPPADQQEWEKISALVNQPSRQALFGHILSGQNSIYSNVDVKHLRRTTAGFRFDLRVDEDARVAGVDLLGVAEMEPGNYVIEYDDQDRTFRRSLARPAPPQLLDISPLVDPAPSLPAHYRLRLHNPGNVDLENVHLELLVEENADWVEVEKRLIRLPAEESRVFPLVWTATTPGEHRLQLRLTDGAGELLLTEQVSILVNGSDADLFQSILEASSGGNWWAAAVLLFLIAALSAVLVQGVVRSMHAS